MKKAQKNKTYSTFRLTYGAVSWKAPVPVGSVVDPLAHARGSVLNLLHRH